MSNRYVCKEAIRSSRKVEETRARKSRIGEYQPHTPVFPIDEIVARKRESQKAVRVEQFTQTINQLIRCGVPVITALYALNLYLIPVDTSSTIIGEPSLPQYSPECFYPDEEEEKAENPGQTRSESSADMFAPSDYVITGEPISFTKSHQTAPLSEFFIQNKRFSAANIAFIDCTQDDETDTVQITAQEVISTFDSQVMLQAAQSEVVTATVSLSPTNTHIQSPPELDMPILSLPAEPNARIFFDKDTQANMLMLTNNIGFQFYRIDTVANKITLHKLTDYLPLSAVVPTGCSTYGDVISHIGPNGEMVIATMSLSNRDAVCVLYADSFSKAKTQGFSVFTVFWPGMTVADFPSVLLEEVNGKLYLAMSANGFVSDRPNGKNGIQPMMMLEITDDLLDGSYYVNQTTGGSTISLTSFRGDDNQPIVTGLGRYSSGSQQVPVVGNLQSFKLNPDSNQLTHTQDIGTVSILALSAGCRFDAQSQLFCINQHGSDTDVMPSSTHLDKQVSIIEMTDGSQQFVYQSLLNAGGDTNTVNTDLYIARMHLNPNHTVSQGLSKVYQLQDQSGKHINVTDCQTFLQPNGEMLVTCVGLDVYEANVIIALEINNDGSAKSAQVVRSLKEAFKGTRFTRSGDYNGAGSTKGMAVTIHYIGYRTVTVIQAMPGYTVELAAEEPEPTLTPTAVPPDPTSQPTLTTQPLPTLDTEKHQYLPLTHK
jgi:hypothetical protein